MKALDYSVTLDVICEGYDRQTEWFQPRIGVIPASSPGGTPGAVLTMTRAQLWGSDIFTAVQQMRSDDFGRTWSKPEPQATLDRQRSGAMEECPCDMTPAWHAKSETLLSTGHTAVYLTGDKGALVNGNEHRRYMCWSTYDAAAKSWRPWQKFVPPDAERFYWSGAGCTQRVDLPDGEVLLPMYCMDRVTLGDNLWKGCFFATVARFAFDGREMRYIEHGDEMTVADKRGFCEPSLAKLGDRFYLTLRNDVRGYVTSSADGLHFDKPVAWAFDDGQELGSYNTQQHWVTHSDGLFLTYTRRGANNDEVFRHRAPLFIAQVDPKRLCVLRQSERMLVPNRGAQLGNFGVVNASAAETWVVTSEGMQGDAKQPGKLELTEARGADNRVYLCRLRWNG